MKELKLMLPDWIEERRVVIVAGMELVAIKMPNKSWKVKKIRCNQCGQCCMTFKPNSSQTPFGVDDEGKCKALKFERGTWECTAGTKKPYMCLLDPIDEPECCITYEE